MIVPQMAIAQVRTVLAASQCQAGRRVSPTQLQVAFGGWLGLGLGLQVIGGPSRSIRRPCQVWRAFSIARCASTCARDDSQGSEAAVRGRVRCLSVGDIRRALQSHGINTQGMFEKDDMVERLVQAEMQVLSGSAACGVAPQESGSVKSSDKSDTKTAAKPQEGPDALLAKCMSMKAGELRSELRKRDIPCEGLLEKAEFAERLARALIDEHAFCSAGHVRPGRVSELTAAQIREELRGTAARPPSDVPLLIDVYAPWCGPCKMMAPSLEAAAARLGRRARVVKVNSDAEPGVLQSLGVRAFPTVLLFDAQGKELSRFEGALSEDQLVSLVS